MMTTETTDTPQQPAAVGAQVQRGVRPAVAEAVRLAHAYADAKLMRYGMLCIKNPPDPQAAFEALQAAINAAVEDERLRIAALIAQHSGLTLETLEYLETMRQGPTPQEWAALDANARA